MNPRYGWVMVALGAFMTCIAIGAMFSLAVFLQPITQATGWSHAEVSAAMTIGFLSMGAAGFGWGALSDRIGPRWVVLTGAVLLGLGRAMGETIAAALVIGSSAQITSHLFAPGYNMPSVIANQFGEASGEFRAALIGLGVLLFVFTIIINIIARTIVGRSAEQGTA